MSVNIDIKPSLWLPGNAEEAVDFYLSIFPSSKINSIARYTAAGQHEHGFPVGTPMFISFTLNERPFLAINGPPYFQFTRATSFTITCDTQEQIDHYWERLGAGGKHFGVGWVTDKFGLSWRVIPTIWEWMVVNGTEEQRYRVGMAKAKTGKFDIEKLWEAFKGDQNRDVELQVDEGFSPSSREQLD